MKRGFALLETIVVITFVSVSLLLLYTTFNNMLNNSQKNILYDDAANIYTAYYLKEYLDLNDLTTYVTQDINEISCKDLHFGQCEQVFETLNINKIYITKYKLKTYETKNYTSMFNNYLKSLSNKGNYEYRFILEIKNGTEFSYASIGFNGDENV